MQKTHWRLAWFLTAILVSAIGGSAGFLFLGLLVLLVETLLTGKTSWGRRYERLSGGAWYGGWWLVAVLALMSRGYFELANMLLLGLVVSMMAIARFDRYSHRFRGHKHKH